jgi:prevent-host-death family protein
MAMKRVGVAELKDQLSKHLRAVEAGEEIEVTDRGRPIARIVPARPASKVPIRAPTRPFSEIRDRIYPPADLPIDIVELLLEDRRKR